MIPTEFIIGSGRSSEREFLLKVLEAGVTYIADRGYASFEIVAKLLQSQAYFVFRVKDNLLYEGQEVFSRATEQLPNCFGQVRDELVVFKNDKNRNRVRLIQFKVAGSFFRLITNRLELSTLQIIILYAYRCATRVIF